MSSQRKLLLIILLVIGIVLIQPVFAPELYSTSIPPVPTASQIKIVSATASPTEGTAPLTVQFKDTSRVWSKYCQWNFGDGTNSSGNPHTTSHTYSQTGTYFVYLTIQDMNYKQISAQVATITVTSPPTTRFLSINPMPDSYVGDVIYSSGIARNYTGNYSLTVRYQTDAPGTGIWRQRNSNVSVMNGTWSDSVVNTSDFRTGKWTATVNNSNGTSTSTSFNVQPAVNITVVNITANVTSGCTPLTVQFTGTATGNPTSWSWNFGDSSPTATVQNPVHTFISSGNYNVTLTATSQSGSNSVSKPISAGCVVPVSDVSITTWTKDGEYTLAGAEVYLGGKEGRLLGKTGIDGSFTVSVPYDTSSLYAKSPVYKDSYFYEGEWTWTSIMVVRDPSPTPSPITILLDQKVPVHYTFSEADNNTTVSMKKGSAILLRLGENGGSTGYRWELTTTSGLKVTNDSFEISDTCDGCGGTRTWEMTADSTGQQQVVAVSKRSWEPATGNERTFRMTMNVE